ncbi:MAG: hypothetical protein EU981_03430 [Candidatus Liberibacter ctenarytainae]|uniref:Restriction endonuclease type II EcoRII C-terminal domain-containing protein n=1 Tax=Candidatus Liberibacter ctenarytainae TaxID=2020335 RepID=A0A937DJ68_9HYPH|nr:hypothetical protein [Candidatus Liberibacter ctenarytainae]
MFSLKTTASREIFCDNLITKFGDYTGEISQYLYQLFLSNTQSRRSRAGKTFEEIIYYLYERLNYSFDSQKRVGKKTSSQYVGGRADSILPGIDQLKKSRDNETSFNYVVIGTMKTTLRERWQEVVEERDNSHIPVIHLLTIDSNISEEKAQHIAGHNIVLVVLSNVKEREFLKRIQNVISFEMYFFTVLPDIFSYWKNNV